MLQHLYHQEKYLSVDFSSDTNYAAIAQGFGLRAARIEHPGELGAALRQALSSEEATFLDIVTESEVTHAPPVAAWQQVLAGRPKQTPAEVPSGRRQK